MRLFAWIGGLSGLLVGATAASAQIACTPAEGRSALSFTGEVAGDHAYEQAFGPSWVFALEPSAYGWDLRIYDADRLDLSMVTPPYRVIPNPREIYGWHFRNAANSGPNEGDVNAPQDIRDFFFSPGMTGTAGWRPPDPGVFSIEPGPDDGTGTLHVLDYGLADLGPGQMARMVWLSFEVCLEWPAALDVPVRPDPTPALRPSQEAAGVRVAAATDA